MGVKKVLGLLAVCLCYQPTDARWNNPQPDRFNYVPNYGPQPNLPYMVDNQHNYFKAAPDKGTQNGAVWAYSGSFENYITNLKNGHVIRGGYDKGLTPQSNGTTVSKNSTFHDHSKSTIPKRDSSYWLTTLAPLGSQPLAGSGYKFYRNVVDDYGADQSGDSDTTEALNAAIQDGNRCGEECGNTFTQGAIIYFPPGTYKICSPVIQYYYTQFIGDAGDPPTIKGCDTFKGIALFDTDPYIPGGGGDQWYVNQNQFFRHIRNFIFDLNDMPLSTSDNDQPLVPTGIHWQASQATTLQNLVFNMPHADNANSSSHVGIFMENGSGGFVSDLTFNGGAIGWRAGSQQYTARNLKFYGCLTAVQMVWDWGFNWQGIEIHGGGIAFNISGKGGDTGQGTGSVSIIDSTISDVPTGILTNSADDAPNILLDNVYINNVAQIIQQDGGSTILDGTSGSQTINLWGIGRRYNGSDGSYETGDITAPPKGAGLLSGNSLYVRSRPQYEDLGTDNFLVATDNNIKNDGTGDQASAINSFLLKASAAGQIAYFPAGIYQVGSTVFIPTGSRVQGASWSQIQGAGFYFSDMNNPQVMVQVGNKGDVGDMEIVEMLFTVKGATAGAILMEWNVEARTQGSAAMWDSHFRVGGGTGTDLDSKICPKRGFNEQCIAASLMLHVTQQASGYFENVWAWVADHDNDYSVYDSPDKLINQVSVYGARGMLIESQGPSWFYGTGSEHSVLYNYQLNNAKNIYLGHIQTESPYYQPEPVAPEPFRSAKSFAADPSFDGCTTTGCKESWGLRVVDSTNITLHSAGLYSFFQDYYQDCLSTEDCQERILEVTGSYGVVIYNLFTVATSQIAMGIDKTVIYQNQSQSGFTTEVNVWLPLPGQDNVDIVYVGTEIWSTPTVACPPPCILVLPSSSLSSSTTIDPGDYTTSLEYGNVGSITNTNGQVITTFFTTTTTITVDIPSIVTDGIPYSNVNVTNTQTSGGFIASPSVPISPIGVPLPDGTGGSTTRTIQLPPWPDVTNGPPDNWGNPTDPFNTGSSTTVTGTYYLPYNTTITATGPTVTTISFPSAIGVTTVSCPPNSEVTFVKPKTTLDLECPAPTAFTYEFSCPSTKVVTFLAASAGVFTVDCSLITLFPTPTPTQTSDTSTTTTTTTPLPVWITWPPGIIVPVTTSVDEPKPTDDGTIVPCNLWFFFICISDTIGGWHLILPKGIYPSGPPPPIIQWPTPLKIEGTLPPWPKFTIGQDNQITYPDEPTSSCTTQTASVCSTTTFLTETVTGGTTSTITSTSTGRCEEIEGCSATNTNTGTTTTTTVACTPTASGTALNVCDNDAIIFPDDPENVGNILTILAAYSGKYEQAQGGGATAFIWVPALDQETFNTLKASSDVYDVQYYEPYNKATPFDDDENPPSSTPGDPDADLKRIKRDIRTSNDNSTYDLLNNQRVSPFSPLVKRAAAPVSTSRFWQRSVNSLAKKQIWREDETNSYTRGANEPYQYWYDSVGGWDSDRGEGYNVYIINENWVYSTHPEWTVTGSQGAVELISPGYSFNDPAPRPAADGGHGSGVAAQINGYKVGTCKRCQVVWFATARWTDYPDYIIRANSLIHLYKAYEDIKEKGTAGKAVINMSFSWMAGEVTPATLRSMKWILDRLDLEQNVVLVASSGNHAQDEGREITRYPAKFGNPRVSENPFEWIKNLITVGATDGKGYEGSFSQNADYLTTYAPGVNVWCPDDPNGANGADPWVQMSGTSFAAPAVAGIAAYLRSLDGPFKASLENPTNVKLMINFLAHRSDRQKINNVGLEPLDASKKKPIAWNGQVQSWERDDDGNIVRDPSGNPIVQSHSCLADWDSRETWDYDNACDGLNPDMTQMTTPGESTGDCDASGNPLKRRDDTGTCPLDPNGSGSGGTSITFTSGPTPSPTCAEAGGCGGTVCSGYYCTPSPTGTPPDYWDPKDPSNGQPVPTKTIGDGGTTTTTSTTPTSTCDDKCKLDRGNPCTCNENGCDENSPSCCANGSCPTCNCGESSCSPDSPACCASGTCAWSWTGGGGGLQSISSQFRASSFENASEPMSVYDLWSLGDGSGSVIISGFDGELDTSCNEMAEWQSAPSNGLQTMYANLTVYGDTCNYLASVATYDEVLPGALIGSLTCGKWAPAACFRGNYTATEPCGGGSVAKQLVCQWS